MQDGLVIIWVGLGLYMVAMVLIGFYVMKWVRSATDFVLTGRQTGVLVAACGLAAINIAGTATAAVPGLAYQSGWVAIMFNLGWVIAMIVYAFIVPKFARRTGTFSILEWFGVKFDTSTRTVAAIAMLAASIASIMAQFVGTGGIVSGLTGWPQWQSVLLVGVITMIYVVTGGLWATIVTDFYQQILGIIFLYLGLPLFLLTRYGSYASIAAQVPPALLTFPGKMPWFGWLYPTVLGFVVMNAGFQWAGQAYWARFTSVRTEKGALQAAVLAGLIVLPFCFLYPLAGIYARAINPGITNPDAVFGWLMGQMPAVLAAGMLIAIFASSQSTADAYMIAATTVFLRDIYQRFFRPDVTAENLVIPARVITIAVGVLSLGLALFYPYGAVYGIALITTFVIPLVPILLASMWWRGATKEGATIAALVCFVLGLYWGVFTPFWKTVAHTMYVLLIVSTFLLVAISLIVNHVTGPWWGAKRSSQKKGVVMNG